MSDVYVVIAAAGAGQRFGGDSKKQFLSLHGKSVLQHSLDFFLRDPRVKQVAVVLPAAEAATFKSRDHRVRAVTGGECRAASVRNGVLSFESIKNNDCILVHDAARPCLSADVYQRVLDAVNHAGAAVPVLPVADTLKQVIDNRIIKTVDRAHLFAAQTPQGARFAHFVKAYALPNLDLAKITDEAMLLEMAGFAVDCVVGDKANIKITTPDDFKWLEFWFANKDQL